MSEDKTSDIKKYTLSETVAKDVGVEESIMFWNIYFWVEFNSKKPRKDEYFHDGGFWMYCTVREFTEKYSFWTESKIKRILRNLERAGYIKTGVFNKWSPDKTKWYSITKKGYDLINSDNRCVVIGDSW